MRKPTVGLRLRIWVVKANGKKKLVRDRWSRSFVQQWIDIWYGHFRNTVTGFTVKRTDGVSAANYNSHTLDTTAQGNVDTYGIVVGSGEAAVSVSDYKLQTQILHGDTPGKLFHSVGKVCPQTFAETDRKWFEYNRSFINMTKYEIVVREVGIYGKETTNNYYYCFVRDVIGHIVAPPLGGIIVNYIFELSL